MLDVLVRLRDGWKFKLTTASVDHGLRPEAPDEVRLVGELAGERGVAFVPLRLSLPATTTPAQARDARYVALHQVARDVSALRIAVGHTLDDQAETVLARITRGAGLRGLRGVLPLREDGVMRPLLDASRAEVRAHLAAYGIQSVDDPTNVDPHYQRSRLRASLIPALAAESPAIVRHLAALADEAAEVSRWADSESARITADFDDSSLSWTHLGPLAPPVRDETIATLVEATTGRRPGREVRKSIVRALQEGGSVLLGGGFTLSGTRGQLSFELTKRRRGLERPTD